MKSQFQAVLRDAMAAKRTGALSGSVTSEAPTTESGGHFGKGFSLLLRSGELVGCEFAGRSGLSAALAVMDAPTIAKARWFNMKEEAISSSAPLIPAQQLLHHLDGKSPVPQVPAALDKVTPASLEPICKHATAVFQQFLGARADGQVGQVISALGPSATPKTIAEECITILVPMLGAEMARGYFKQFL